MTEKIIFFMRTQKIPANVYSLYVQCKLTACGVEV